MPLKKVVGDGIEVEDAEGNRIRIIRVADGVDDFEDTEGNRFHGIVKDGTDGLEDTEGNRFHGAVTDGTDEGDDTEGNFSRRG